MSGAPKRPYEEGGHSSSKHPHEESGSHSRPPSTEYHPPYDVSQDSRMSKIARTEPCDMDRRSPIQSVYRMPSSSFNDSHSDHPGRPNNKLDLKDPKDNKEVRGDSRDAKIEKRELYKDAKKDSQSAKGEKDSKHNLSKDMLHEKESYYDSKGGTKIDKDGYGGAVSHSSLKESNDYHRGKGSFGSPDGHVDSWHISRSNSQGPVELRKDGSITDGRDHVEVREAVGENRVDSKGEDKHKDKDKRRQDTKHRDWEEKEKERSERKVISQAGMSSGDCKESTKEEDAEKWKRDRKDFSREKERPKEREKEQVKQDPWNATVKQNLLNEKDARDSSTRVSQQENLVPDQKKQKEPDGLDNSEKEGKDRKKERDTDVKGDRSGKRNRGNEKEPEDGGIDGEETNEKEREREASGYGIQQKRRMLRARSSPQRANREPRFKACSAEIEGSQGKTDDSAVVYKIGECMHELIKLWKEHEASQTDKSAESSQNGPALEIRIPAEHVTATNRQVRGGQLWGTDVYTYDSDLVAVLMHTGYCRPTASPPPPAIQELQATIRVLPPQDCYISTLRNNVRSRAWGSAIGCSYRVERCCIVKKGGGTINLEPCLTHASTVEPTIAPVAVERAMTTRAAASNALRQQRFLREVTIQYNLCNEPWIKYSLNVVADKGLKKPLYTSARLKKGEVLYLETHTTRYELCFTGEKVTKAALASLGHEGEVEKPQNQHSNSTNGDRNDSDNIVVDLFRWSRCKRPLPQNLMRSIGIPLPLEHVQVLEDNIEWEDVQWSQTGVWVNGKEYPLARVHFLTAD